MEVCKSLIIYHFVDFSVSTGASCRPRSSSVDRLVESSFSVEPSISFPSKTHRNKEFEQSKEASYLVIGEGEVMKEKEYVNYQSEDSGINKSKTVSSETEKPCSVSPPMTHQMRAEKPGTSSDSTTFTLAPSVSSSSSSAPHSGALLSPVSMDCDLKSPCSLHDSTISRLIDAVSLGNEQDTCGSISVLIGQFESTFDQNSLMTLSHNDTPSRQLNFRPNTPKTLQDLRSPVKIDKDTPKKKHLISNVSHTIMSPCKTSQAGTPVPALLSSPETSELEEVYTILDEEVLLPVSVYNLRKQTVHVQADSMESSPSNSLASSPVKVVQSLSKGHNVGWDDMYRKRGVCDEIEEAEERVYEEVYDPPAQVTDREWGTSRQYMNSFVNDNHFQVLQDAAGHAIREVEINVDEDPLDTMLTSVRHGNQWKELTSPTKRHAIYQNHEPTPNYSQHKQALSYHRPQHYPSHASHAAFLQLPSPTNQPSHPPPNLHQHQSNCQPSPLHRPINSRPPNLSLLRQNTCPAPQSNSNAFNDSSLYTQHRSYSVNQILKRSNQDGLGYQHIEREQVRRFHNGFSSSESLPSQSPVSINIHRDRDLFSPSPVCDVASSHLDYNYITPSVVSSAPQNTQPHCQSQTQLHIMRQSRNNLGQQSNFGPLSTHSQSVTKESVSPSPCKSKSLGDLTSEDISCNFESKYHIISRSFITPHMRKQKRMGTAGKVTALSQSCDPLTEQLRKLVSLEGDDSDVDRPQSSLLCQEPNPPLSQPQSTSIGPRDIDDSPPLLTRRLSSRSQSRVRHINSRARERQQEALKPRAGVVINSTANIGGVVLRNKPGSQNPPVNRHSTGSYIAGYLGQLEDRGLPEGACTTLLYGNGDHYGDRYYTDDSVPPPNSSHSVSEPEVYFLLRL